MRKLIRFTSISLLALMLFSIGSLLADKQTLRNDVIRLHVVANSDDPQDQQIKLSVRDAVIGYIQSNMQDVTDVEQAKAYLKSQLQDLQNVANDTLRKLGSSDFARVCLKTEEFGVRAYDTFSLPSGIYESLRIEIGDARGKNWWCVVFPSLCIPSSREEFTDTAVSAGFEQGLTNTLSQKEGYEIRFFLLDCLGKIENFFCFS